MESGCPMLLSFDPNTGLVVKTQKISKKINNHISTEANQHWKKTTSSNIYLWTDLPKPVKEHLAGKNGPHQFWCKRHNCILMHLQKAHRCGLDRSCSSCKYALLWQVPFSFQRVGRCIEEQKKPKQPWEYMKNSLHLELELSIFILKPG